MGRVIVAALAVAGMIVGTAAGPVGGPDPGGRAPARVSPGIAWGACPADVAAPGLRCGTLAVPIDHARPDGPTTTLGVSMARALGGKPRLGTIVVNPGGPGGGGMWLADLVGRALPERVRQSYDIVGVDPRGNHHSDPISCVDPSFDRAPKPDPVPVTAQDEQRLVERARDYARGCAERAGDLLPHLGTSENARDLDLVRAALGEPRISFIGWSYGTYLGAVYGQSFPERVDRMILDSVVDPRPDQIWYGANLRQDVAFQARWRDFVAAEGADLDDVFARVLAHVRVEPAGGRLGPAELRDIATRILYGSQTWPGFARALRAHDAGDPAPLAALYAPPTAQDANGTAVYTAVECHDGPWPRDWSVWDRDARAVDRVAPLVTWSNTWLNAPCAFWPVPARTPPTIDGHDLPPVLLIQGTRDPATPPAGAGALHHALPSSHLITVLGEGDHGILAFQPNDCVLRAAAAYLTDGTLPAGRDTTCEES
ncbi:alpha/beta hydrolase [Embleya sp. NBC_00888]|uniref:alpha/beta hydrolase n=1 Tax=Embleya sp. NBC_00888 TaxID=2975960 RepID=UPI00386D304A|nr:alpha/beta hydrolase [Embleya sp. NBC_00888]